MNKSTPISQLPKSMDPPVDDTEDDATIQDVLAEINKASAPDVRQMQALPPQPTPSQTQQQLQLQLQLQQLQQQQQQQFQQAQQQQFQQMMPPQQQPQQQPQYVQYSPQPSIIASISKQLWDAYFNYAVLFAIVAIVVFFVSSTPVEAFIVAHVGSRIPNGLLISKAALAAALVVGATAFNDR